MKVVDGVRQVVLGAREELEVVDKFCYLGDVIGKGAVRRWHQELE